jgi:hypothetical protein
VRVVRTQAASLGSWFRLRAPCAVSSSAEAGSAALSKGVFSVSGRGVVVLCREPTTMGVPHQQDSTYVRSRSR